MRGMSLMLCILYIVCAFLFSWECIAVQSIAVLFLSITHNLTTSSKAVEEVHADKLLQ